ncbi:MAG TPA: hypothetical protein GXZ45_15280 [Propionibacterium sp.]|nr:hypothetical protein [Propionibacterium sp.]
MAQARTSPVRRSLVFLAARLRQGARRVRGSAVPILQASIAAGAAYLVAEQLFGRSNPMFAPIATWVCLGFKADRVPRKVAELGVGATVGVLLGEAFALWMDVGWWQIAVALFVGAVVGRFLDRGDLTTIQAGVNAVVVIGMSWWQTLIDGVTGRWIDAVVGAGVAFVVAVLLPRHPTSRPRRYARSTLTEYATLLALVGRGLRTGDVGLLADAQAQRRAVTELSTDWEDTLSTAREVVALNPGMWRHRGEVAELDRIFRLMNRVKRSSYLLSRQGLAMAEEVGPITEVGDMLLDVSTAVHALSGSLGHWNQPHRARELLRDVARRAAPSEVQGTDWRPVALMSLLRAIVVDLLQMTGLSRAQARDALSDTWGRPFEDPDIELTPSDSDDDASPLWGSTG